MTNNEYKEHNKKISPNSKSYKNIPAAFLVGGLICCLGELILNGVMYMGMEKDMAFTTSSITLVFLSALLTGLDIYGKIAKFAGAGTLVPITGFANAVVSPALEFKSEGYILGLGAKLFSISGPVIVYGVSASVAYGLIIYIFKLY